MAISTQGRNYSFAIGSISNPTSIQNYSHFRPDEDLQIMADGLELIAQSNVGKRHFADVADKPHVVEVIQQDAVNVKCRIRSNVLAGQNPFWISALSTICNVTENETAEVLASLPVAGVFTTTSNVLGEGHGAVLGAGSAAVPCLTEQKSGSGPYTQSLAAYDDDHAAYNNLRKSWTITPTTVEPAKYMSIRTGTRLAAAANQEHWTTQCCAVSKVGTIEIKPNEPITMDFSLHAAKVVNSDAVLDAEVFSDSEAFCLPMSDLDVAFANSSTRAAWVPVNVNALKMNIVDCQIELGVSSVPIIGAGMYTTNLNACIGYMPVYEQAKVTFKALFEKSFFTDVTSGVFQEKYFHIIQKATNTANRSAFGFFAPRCYQAEKPQIIAETGSYYMAQITLLCSAANFTANTSWVDNAAAPWFIVANKNA
jgi:hypothetical protein